MINMNLFWKLVNDVKWFKYNNRKYLKIWIPYENLEEFSNLLNINYENYIMNCVMLENCLYLEFGDFDVYERLGFNSVNEFIAHTGIEEY